MKKYAGSEAKYLKAEDIKGKNLPPVTIAEVIEVEFTNRETGKPEVKPAISFVGKEKQVACSPSTVRELIKAFGPSSNDWVGRKVLLGTTFWPGLGKDGITVTAITSEEPGW